jgi:hypothetical protein
LFSISENAAVVAGMNSLARCGKVLILVPNGVVTIDVGEYENWLERARKGKSKSEVSHVKPTCGPPVPSVHR